MMTRTIENRKPKTMGRTRELAASRAQQPPGTAGNATNHKTMRHKEKGKKKGEEKGKKEKIKNKKKLRKNN